MKTDCVFGKIHCAYDDKIVLQASRYGMPGGILKAIIDKESGFNPERYRYEPLRDYVNYSGPDGYTNITSHSFPFYHFALPGHNTVPQTIGQGDKVPDLTPPFTTIIRSYAVVTGEKGWGLRTIFYSDYNGDKDITFDDLYQNDLNDQRKSGKSQGWATSTIPYLPSLNFTPQLLLSASYGLGQVMYWEATQAKDPSGNKIMKNNNTPYDIANNTALGIELAAAVLKSKFDPLKSDPNDNCAGWSTAVKAYNGSDINAENYKKVVCGMYRENYK
ncbi:MAG: hypothetical protein HY221_01775 [Candidatus Sungbacteria bacterium]|uniref:Uncharacterized protein n=1 Tax=Candidatus Sungiibacteriota bacterium TaxID=2750080 RepID=A0A932R1R5_9BACT|nr:hypothetical protein [Candidatus Sungbacteria bacterium]